MLRAVSSAANSSGAAIAQVLAKCAIPFIIAPTGTMANNGAITLGTALPTTYANAYIYLPAGAIAAGVPAAAAWLFCQMSSTTVGTVFNNTYASGPPTIPSSPTPFVTTGPGAYTGVTTTVVAQSITIPAGALGVNGSIEAQMVTSAANTAGNKTTALTFGGSAVINTTNASVAGVTTHTLIMNRGVLNAQVAPPAGSSSGYGTAAAAPSYLSINTANAQTLAVNATLAVATDYIVIESFTVNVTN